MNYLREYSSPALNLYRTHEPSPSSTFIPTRPPVLLISPQPPDPPDFIESEMLPTIEENGSIETGSSISAIESSGEKNMIATDMLCDEESNPEEESKPEREMHQTEAFSYLQVLISESEELRNDRLQSRIGMDLCEFRIDHGVDDILLVPKVLVHVKEMDVLSQRLAGGNIHRIAHQLFDTMGLRAHSKRLMAKCPKSWRFKFKTSLERSKVMVSSLSRSKGMEINLTGSPCVLDDTRALEYECNGLYPFKDGLFCFVGGCNKNLEPLDDIYYIPFLRNEMVVINNYMYGDLFLCVKLHVEIIGLLILLLGQRVRSKSKRHCQMIVVQDMLVTKQYLLVELIKVDVTLSYRWLPKLGELHVVHEMSKRLEDLYLLVNYYLDGKLVMGSRLLLHHWIDWRELMAWEELYPLQNGALVFLMIHQHEDKVDHSWVSNDRQRGVVCDSENQRLMGIEDDISKAISIGVSGYHTHLKKVLLAMEGSSQEVLEALDKITDVGKRTPASITEVHVLPCSQEFCVGPKMNIRTISGWEKLASFLWFVYGVAIGGRKARQEISKMAEVKHVQTHNYESFGSRELVYDGAILLIVIFTVFVGGKMYDRKRLAAGQKMQTNYYLFLAEYSCKNQNFVCRLLSTSTITVWVIIIYVVIEKHKDIDAACVLLGMNLNGGTHMFSYLVKDYGDEGGITWLNCILWSANTKLIETTKVKHKLQNCQGGSPLEFLKRHEARLNMISAPYNNTKIVNYLRYLVNNYMVSIIRIEDILK